MRMLKTPPFFPPNRGKNHIWKYFPDLASGAIFWMIIYKPQFLHSDWLKTCQLIPDQWNFISATLNHIRFVFFFFITLSKITKEIFAKICWQLKTPTRTWKCTRCIMQMSYLYASAFPFKNFCKIAQHTETIGNKILGKEYWRVLVVDKRTLHDKPYFNFYVFMFFMTISTSQKMFSFRERELRKALRDTLTRAAWLGPGNFWLVRSEHAHASYPGLFFRPPGFSPYMGREESGVQGLDYVTQDL